MDDFSGIPPFPDDVPTAPLLRISLRQLLDGDKEEEEQCWRACRDLGFFYLDCRTGTKDTNGHEHGRNGIPGGRDVAEAEGRTIDGDGLLRDADELFTVPEKFFKLPVEEKMKFDLKDKGSYFGYKGYGDGIVDKAGTRDRNEFYNVSKDDILNLSPPLPAAPILEPHKPLFYSYIHNSHDLITLILNILNSRLGLPEGKLASLHRLNAISGDQIRFVRAPPQPPEDRQAALGAHTDFGSVTVLFNRLGGLQVQLPKYIKPIPPKVEPNEHQANGESALLSDNWTYVRPLPGHAIINLGDALVKFSAGILRSNIHRVVSPPGAQGDHLRYSLVYFSRPEDEVMLKALRESSMINEAFKKSGHPEEEEINSHDWIIRRALGRRIGGDYSKAAGTEESSMRKEAVAA